MAEWIDDLFEEIDVLLSESKQVKFNTHKNRKVLMGKIKSMFVEAVKENTVSRHVERGSASAITRPMPEKTQQGFAVMTKGQSEKGDEVSKFVGARNAPPKPSFQVSNGS